jgi:hypothetical protein
MDASQITKLLQKQNTRYINRSQTVDSSTLTWQNQIQSSKYIKGVKTCEGQQNTNVPTNPACSIGNGICEFGGSGRTTALQTGSPQHYLNVLSGAAGSASQVYSSESITLQRAGKESCGVPGVSPAPHNSYVVLPACYCVDTNGPTNSQASQLSNPTVPGNPSNLPINNQSNPYLPPFDTYYAMKNPQCNRPVQDQNQKHFVKQCIQCPGEPPVPISSFIPNTLYTIEQPQQSQQLASFYYNLCLGGGDVPLPTIPEITNIPVLPTIVNGPLPGGGSFSIQISPQNTSIGTNLLDINPVTGALSWPTNSGNIGGTYIINYSGPFGSITTGDIFIDANECA